MPADLVVANMDDGESAEDVISNYQLKSSVPDVVAVYKYAVEHLARQPA